MKFVGQPESVEKRRKLEQLIHTQFHETIHETVSTAYTLALYFSPSLSYEAMCRVIGELEQQTNFLSTTPTPSRLFEIPVLYGGEEGPDLAIVAEHNGMTEEEVIVHHTAGTYPVTMIGFVPGFPYLEGLSAKLHTPRKTTPRISIPAGSVGIAGGQTGIYSISTPGGWQIIGRTNRQLFLPDQDPPSLLQAGDRVKFVAVGGLK
ncbi:5-oxoprolinase subunit PxpB [Chryseomicrobium palamuruense]|uniref:5-oxoprolinase subunit PxpB n=1 Tax=Chryseomicrobium palamuruense TaxID=682973 RepID=A0ABV8UVU9_9BACL